MEPDRIQEFGRIPPGLPPRHRRVSHWLVAGAIVAEATTSPNEILRDLDVWIVAIIGAVRCGSRRGVALVAVPPPRSSTRIRRSRSGRPWPKERLGAERLEA
jgi:hypothetical protein